MSKFNKQDMELLSEAYTLRLLKESAPHMTLTNLEARIPHMTQSEAEYVTVVCERITDYMIQEGMLGNAWQGAKSVGGAIGRGIKGAAQGAGGALKAAGQGIANTARGVGSVAQNIGSNVKNLYQTGQNESQSGEAITKAETSMQELIDLVTQAQQMGLIKSQGSITDMTLANIMDELTTAKQSAGQFSQDAQKRGIGGGNVGAFKQGFNRGAAPAAPTP